MISCVNKQNQFVDNFKTMQEFRGVACVFSNICNYKSEDKGNL